MNKFVQGFLILMAAALLSAGNALALDVNKASLDELQSVKGVGPVIAKRIASERKKSRFKSLADLQERVPGVGPQIAANLNKGSGLPKGKMASKTTTKSSKTAKGKVTNVADKGKKAKSSSTAKPQSTKKVAKANTKSSQSSTKKLAKKDSNNNKK